jgi:hypothetical protein
MRDINGRLDKPDFILKKPVRWFCQTNFSNLTVKIHILDFHILIFLPPLMISCVKIWDIASYFIFLGQVRL